jgi:nucleoside-diphosphate-sugar epimerase
MGKKRVLVCGATGFIGRNVAERLAERDDLEVHGTCYRRPPLTNPKISMHQVNLLQAGEAEKILEGMDVVVQAAATTSGAKDIVARPHIHVTDNAVMNSLLFRAAHDRELPHLVFFSCSIMYQPSDTPLTEDDFNPADALHEKYFGAGWTKVYLEKMCEFFSKRGKTKYTVIRHSNMYGPYDKYDLERSHVFGATIVKVMTAPENGAITVWGTGEEERDLLHVSDLVNFVECAIDRQENKFELVNVGLGRSVSVADLVKKIIAASGKNLSIKYDPAGPTIKTKLALESSKAKRVFGWQPKISLDDGIRMTIDWYRKHVAPAAK